MFVHQEVQKFGTKWFTAIGLITVALAVQEYGTKWFTAIGLITVALAVQEFGTKWITVNELLVGVWTSGSVCQINPKNNQIKQNEFGYKM